VDNYTSITQQL